MYPSDLNALFHAELKLSEIKYLKYEQILHDLMKEVSKQEQFTRWITYPPLMKSRAFLMTIGKWKNERQSPIERP